MVIRQRQETFKPVTLGHHLVSPANQGQRHCHAARILSDWSPKQARADFVMFLSGELPARLLKEAQLWVSEEQGCEPPSSIEDPIMTTEHPGDPSCVPQASSNSRYEPIQASW